MNVIGDGSRFEEIAILVAHYASNIGVKLGVNRCLQNRLAVFGGEHEME